jgi:hypothetical protein
MQLELNLAEIRSILKDNPLTNIYNMNKTALYWRSSPNNSLISEKLKGGEADKSRITANFCYNADGSYKLDIFFIVKVLHSRTFKSIRYIESLRC